MDKKENAGWSNLYLLVLAALLLAGSCVFHLKNAHAGTPAYRDQHLSPALVYYKTHHIDLLRPIIVGFNANNVPTPQEFPIWQAMVGLAFQMFGPWFGWATVVSLLVFVTCLFPMFEVTKMFMGERCAWWTMVFFLSQPLVFMYAGIGSTDGLSIVAAIWFLYCGAKLVRHPGVLWWLATCLTGALAATSKLPFFLAFALVMVFVLATRYRTSVRSWVFLSSVGAVIMVLFFWWTHYTDSCIAAADLPFVDVRVSNSEHFYWYFGDLHFRLQLGSWLKGGWRVLNCCFGSFALAALFLYGLFFIRENPFPKWIFLASFLSTLVFTHLVLMHSHYYLMFAPAFAIFCGQAACEWEKRFSFRALWQSNLAWVVVAVALGLSVVQGLIGMKVVLHYDPFPYDMAKLIQKYTLPTDKILMRGGGWGGNEFILSDRDGLTIWDTKLLENPATLEHLKKLGFNKLVMVSESPLLTALEQINPGESRRTRETYRPFITSVAKDWPTLFESDDLLVKSIP